MAAGTATSSSLADFLEDLEQDGELVRVPVEVDRRFEVAEITRQVAAAEGPALLFQQVAGCSLPLATNLFGTTARLCRALGVAVLSDLDPVLGDEQETASRSWLPRLVGKRKPSGSPVRVVRGGACQQVVELGADIDLTAWPLPHAWPAEFGPCITAGQLIARSAATGEVIIENSPIAVLGPRTLAVVWHPHLALAQLAAARAERGEPLPIAIALGGPAILSALVLAPLASEVNRFELASKWLGGPIEVVRARTFDLPVPAEAEMVIEGTLGGAAAADDDSEAPPEPIQAPQIEIAGEWGFLTPPLETRIIHVEAVTRRANAVVPAIIAGQPRHEGLVLAQLVEPLARAQLRADIPAIRDLSLPVWSRAGGAIVVALAKSHPRHAYQAAAAVAARLDLAFARLIVVVDDDVAIRDDRAVGRAVAAHVDPVRDLHTLPSPAHPLDRTAAAPGMGHTIVIDATSKTAIHEAASWPARLQAPPDVAEKVAQRWSEYGLKRS